MQFFQNFETYNHKFQNLKEANSNLYQIFRIFFIGFTFKLDYLFNLYFKWPKNISLKMYILNGSILFVSSTII